MTLQCSNCEALHPHGAKFCSNCGTPLSSDQPQHSDLSPIRRPDTLPESSGSPVASGRPDQPPEAPGRSGGSIANPVGAGWSPSKPPPVKETPYSHALSNLVNVVAGNKSRQHPRGKIVGEVRNLQERHETDNSQKTWTIWSFRVESFDRTGNRMQPVPVEMRGRTFQGMLNEGDQIEIRAKWREGQTLRVTEVYNTTTGSKVIVKKGVSGTPIWVWNIVFFIVLGLAAAFVCNGMDF